MAKRDDTHGLSKQELDVARMFGIEPDEYAFFKVNRNVYEGQAYRAEKAKAAERDHIKQAIREALDERDAAKGGS